MRYWWKRKASIGDVARISFLLLAGSSLSWVASVLLTRDFGLACYLTILTMEHMALAVLFSVTGHAYDFTDTAPEPRGWIASIYLEPYAPAGNDERGRR